MMSNGGFRSHVIGCLITNSFLEIVYYDHSAVIVSRAIDFKKDLRSFIQFLHAFVSGGESVWGSHWILKEPQTGFRTKERAIQLQELPRAVCVDAFKNFTLSLQDGSMLTLGTTVFQAHGLIGRGTLVVRAAMPQGDKRVIVKLSHLPKTRISESEIIKVIRDASGRAGLRSDGRNMANHLPQVIYAEKRVYSLDTPQGRLAEFYKNDNNVYELRDLCILVQEELHPITNLTTADELASAFRDIFEAYRWLCEDVKIMHRDISINNLMVRYQDGRHYGVLNDFDLAIEVKKDLLPTSKQRTGADPFMACDLLDVQLQIEGNPPPHLYRYDLESLLYVLVFLTTHYNNGKEIENPPLERWYNLDTPSLCLEKYAFLARPSLPFTPAFESLVNWVSPMRRLFRQGYAARDDHAIDSALDTRRGIPPQHFCTDTLGGKVTFDTFSALLEKELK
ncbi:hypothetical protein GGX14DRAFT_670581 [Mycena pura]|uniref:Protein kinase domain-containing protein n=1 Tax=Mycena pura TaxID=153505 RepID=A0AAD6YHE8_9AGAR|nr:hypothetical protein GGX14DRAFT_670581 [Mycena pura]